VDVRRRGQRQQAERGNQRDAESPKRRHLTGSVPAGSALGN
jgi:hypothetical protein